MKYEHVDIKCNTFKVGKNCKFGNNVKIQAQSGIGRNIKDDEVLQGSPAFGYGDFNKSYVYFKNLPKIMKEINEIDKKVNGNS